MGSSLCSEVKIPAEDSTDYDISIQTTCILCNLLGKTTEFITSKECNIIDNLLSYELCNAYLKACRLSISLTDLQCLGQQPGGLLLPQPAMLRSSLQL